MSVACQFFPIPTMPAIAFTAKAFHPVLVAFVGALGTVIAYVIDYAILRMALPESPCEESARYPSISQAFEIL